MVKNVIKRDGSIERFDAEKLNRWGEWAADNNVGWPDVLLEAIRSFPDSVSSEDIQNTLISVCINRRDTAHSRMAARLLMGLILKEAYESCTPPKFRDFYHSMVGAGYWMDMGYTEEELEYVGSKIIHERDFGYEFCTIRQFYDKYSVSAYGRCLESPQMAAMATAMANTRFEENRAERAVEAYEELSLLTINLPTPSLAGQRTPLSGSPSCCVITGGDSVDSIEAAVHVAYKMTAMGSGIGAELETRSKKDPVKNGTIEHMGKDGYYRYLDRAVKSNKQATRGGSATVTFHVHDPEVDMLLRYKSQRILESQRIDSMDYSLAVTKLFMRKAARNEDWMLISVYFAPELYRLSYTTDEAAYEAEYDRLLASNVKKTVVRARDILNLFWTQRSDTGRIYRTNLTNINKHTPFKDPIRLSNLCNEVCLPTSRIQNVESLFKVPQLLENGEIALCFLASIVAGRMPVTDAVGTLCVESYIKTAYQTCKFVDNTIDQCTYPFAAMEYTAKNRRSIGIGLTDVAHYMARYGYKYDTIEGRNALHRLAELHSYALHKASVRLAKERGACAWIDRTKYADDIPWLPIDTYEREIDKHHTQELLCDWEGLREEIKQYGVRFSVHEAFMPVESSSVYTASTNSILPVRELRLFKKSPKGTVYFEAPGLSEFGDRYQNAYDIDPMDMAVVYGIFQKFCGQSISADFYQDLSGGKEASMSDFYKLDFFCTSLGMKTYYYLNTLTKPRVAEEVKTVTVDPNACEACTL